jgi:hypothetical protein
MVMPELSPATTSSSVVRLSGPGTGAPFRDRSRSPTRF